MLSESGFRPFVGGRCLCCANRAVDEWLQMSHALKTKIGSENVGNGCLGGGFSLEINLGLWFWTSWEFRRAPESRRGQAGELQGRGLLGPIRR